MKGDMGLKLGFDKRLLLTVLKIGMKEGLTYILNQTLSFANLARSFQNLN